MGPEKHGDYYWCVGVTKDISVDGEIFLHADRATTTCDGSIAFIRNHHGDKPERINLLIPSGKWTYVYAASVISGHAIAIEWWEPDCPCEPMKRKKERGKMSQTLRFSILERDSFSCVLCGRGNEDQVKLEVDHIIPISKGGKTESNNLRTLCKDCNQGKGDTIQS